MSHSPDLWEDMMNDPALMKRMYDSIPDIESHPRKDNPALADLAKVNGVVHVYNGMAWHGLRTKS